MKDKDVRARSASQRVSNRARERGLSRNDALTAYTMDRLLHRLGRSAHVREFFLKGGVLVANLVTAPHRFTRDVDLLRRHGPPDPDEMRRRFRDVAAVPADDRLRFGHEHVRATLATRDTEGYDGVRVVMRGHLGNTEVPIQIDIGFGDPSSRPRSDGGSPRSSTTTRPPRSTPTRLARSSPRRSRRCSRSSRRSSIG